MSKKNKAKVFFHFLFPIDITIHETTMTNRMVKGEGILIKIRPIKIIKIKYRK